MRALVDGRSVDGRSSVRRRATDSKKKEGEGEGEKARREPTRADESFHTWLEKTISTIRARPVEHTASRFKGERSKRASLCSGAASSSQFPLSSPWQLANHRQQSTRTLRVSSQSGIERGLDLAFSHADRPTLEAGDCHLGKYHGPRALCELAYG